MKIAGEASLKAPIAEVYAALVDPAVLVRTIPGCQRLELVGEDSYRATIQAGVASIKGTFDGDVRLTDRDAPHGFTLHASGAGAPGTVSAVARVTLADGDGGGTLLRYDADATIGGVIGGVGQRMITSVARRTAGEFFTAVDGVLTGAPVSATAPASGRAPYTSESEKKVPMLTPEGGEGFEAADRTMVWTTPVAPIDPARQRVRDLLAGAAFGAIVALLGVIVGAIVAGL
jgi:uncharacterized protein